MNRQFARLSVFALMPFVGCSGQERIESSPPRDGRSAEWSVSADYMDCCCCQPSCPCLFGSSPTLGHCDGVTLVELKNAHYRGVRLDGISVVAVYRGGEWIKFYVTDEADRKQTEAVVKLLPTFEKFFAIENVLEVKNVRITVERTEERVKLSTPNTTVEIELMRGKNGKPIKIENLPAPGFPAPPYIDHTQYRSTALKHDGGDKQFEYTGTNGFTARIETDASGSH